MNKICRNIFLIGVGMSMVSCRSIAVDIKDEPYRGWKSVVLTDGKTKVRAIREAGGRILKYSLDGENIIYEHKGADGKSLPKEKNWFMVGGYQLDLGPESRGIPTHFPLWLGDYTDKSSHHHIILTSPLDPKLKMMLSKEIAFNQTGSLAVKQTMTNKSGNDQSFCLWDRTLCKGGGYVLIPLNKKSKLPRKWMLMKGKEAKPENSSSQYVKSIGDTLIINAKGKGTKLGADSDAGWIAYTRGKLLYIKMYPYEKDGKYTDHGNTVELYFNKDLAELEPLSPEVTLKPGKSFSFTETWHLVKLEKEVTSFEEAAKLLPKIKKLVK